MTSDVLGSISVNETRSTRLHCITSAFLLCTVPIPAPSPVPAPVPSRGFESSPSPEVGSILKHVVTVRMQFPVAPFARFLVFPWFLDEAIIQGEIVSDRILPSLTVVSVEGELVHDIGVDFIQCYLPILACLDGFRYKCYVGIGWLLIRILVCWMMMTEY